jgi:fatty acid/phospholipid biosynthesis enzyme
VLGDARACEASMGAAMRAMEQSDPVNDPAWIAHFTPAYLADEFAHCYRDLDRPRQAREQAEIALAGHPETQVRRRVVDTLLLATSHLQEGDVDAACSAGEVALDMVARVRSARAGEYLRDFDRRLEPHQTVPKVIAFRQRASEVAQPLAA